MATLSIALLPTPFALLKASLPPTTEPVVKALSHEDLDAKLDALENDHDDGVVEMDEDDEPVEKAASGKAVKYRRKYKKGNRWVYIYTDKKGHINGKHLPEEGHKFGAGDAIHTGDSLHRVKDATDTHVTTVDEHGKEHTHTHDELRKKAHDGHKDAIEAHKKHGHEQRKAVLESAKNLGSQPHIARAQKELDKFKSEHGIKDEKVKPKAKPSTNYDPENPQAFRDHIASMSDENWKAFAKRKWKGEASDLVRSESSIRRDIQRPDAEEMAALVTKSPTSSNIAFAQGELAKWQSIAGEAGRSEKAKEVAKQYIDAYSKVLSTVNVPKQPETKSVSASQAKVHDERKAIADTINNMQPGESMTIEDLYDQGHKMSVGRLRDHVTALIESGHVKFGEPDGKHYEATPFMVLAPQGVGLHSSILRGDAQGDIPEPENEYLPRSEAHEAVISAIRSINRTLQESAGMFSDTSRDPVSFAKIAEHLNASGIKMSPGQLMDTALEMTSGHKATFVPWTPPAYEIPAKERPYVIPMRQGQMIHSIYLPRQ